MEVLDTNNIISTKKNITSQDFRDDGAFVFHHPPKFLWERDPDNTQEPLYWKNYHFYIHVPFCRKICTFCTFERKKLHKGGLEWFIKSLEKEMNIYQNVDDFDAANIKSVYFGGGTASLLNNETIEHIIKRLKNEFGLNSSNIEVTLETEPGTKKLSDLKAIRKMGVNRISIGAQAFNDKQLNLLNRSHSVSQTLGIITAARNAGFDNLHIDIMYGLAGQTFQEWKETVEITIDLNPTHVSAYPLIVFPGELLNRTLRNNSLPKRPNAEVINEMRLYAIEQFSDAGLFRYSTAEFARPNYECQYVKSTWDSSDYLGLGPGAYSRNGNQLWEDSVVHTSYNRQLEQNQKPIGKQCIMTKYEQLQRDIAMGFCLLEIDIDELEYKASISFEKNFLQTFNELKSQGLIDRRKSKIFLTESGIRNATYVMKCFTTN